MSGTIIRFLKEAFDAETTGIMAHAFDLARGKMHDSGQPEVVLEVLAKTIIDIARGGERDHTRMATQALEKLGLRDPS